MRFNKLLTSRNLQNSIWNVIEVLLGPTILFVSIPVFLSQLGAEDYGIWMLVNSIVIVMQAFNLGLNFSTYKHVSIAISKKDNQQISDTLNTNLSFTVVILLVSLVVASFICSGVYLNNWFVENSLVKSRLIISILIGMILLFGKLTEQILYNVYRAFEDFKYVTILSIILKIITVLGSIVIAYLTQNVVYVLGFNACIMLTGIFANYKLLARFIPFYRFSFSLNRKLIKHEISYSLFIWFQSIAIIIVYQGDRLLVSYKFGLVALSFYAIVATLFNHIHMAFGAITSWIFPQVAKNKEDESLVFDLYLRTRNVSLVISFLILALFCLFSKPFFTLWLGSENYAEIEQYVKWFSVFEFFLIFSSIPNLFLNASGHERFGLKMVLIFTSFNFVGILIGLFVFNSLIAMVIGLAVSIVPGMYWLHYSVSKRFDKSKPSPFSIAALFLPSIFGSGIAIFDDWLVKSVCFILCLASIFFVYFNMQRTSFKILTE
jgi:O-antigen/teichoic acid export membrane protein